MLCRPAVLFHSALLGCMLAVQCQAPRKPLSASERAAYYPWLFEGWSCSPDRRSNPSLAVACRAGSPRTTLYALFSARASQLAIQSGSERRKENTCRDAAGLQWSSLLPELLDRMSGRVVPPSGDPLELNRRARQAAWLVRKGGVFDCCWADKVTGRCGRPGVRVDWTECRCLAYWIIRGGRPALERAVLQTR